MPEPVVRVKQGKLRGKIFKGANGATNFAFLGIPYAKPPLGNLRFKAPEPPEPWIGIRDALEEGSPCKSMHSEKFYIYGCEDCLFLNVYTPQLPDASKETKFPVMVFIHGGGFYMGSGSAEVAGPDYLLPEKIVFVSFNYRLGIFGFLALDDPSLDVPGNAGLKDQLMALKWIHENITAFGGDPKNITIFGNSAGSASVHYLTLTEKSKGLFQRAILQSGCAVNSWAISTTFTELITDVLGIPGVKDKNVLEALCEKSTEELFNIQQKIIEMKTKMNNRAWVPVIEPPSPSAILTKPPINIILSGKYNKVSLLVGYVAREGIFSRVILSHKDSTPFITDFELEVFNLGLTLQEGTKECNHVAKTLKKFYFGEEEPSAENSDVSFMFWTDSWFRKGINKTLKCHLETNPNPMYLYRFSYDGRLNFLKSVHNIKDSGACHADELGYIFNIQGSPELPPTCTENVIRKSMIRLWTNFAKYGDPNGVLPDKLIKVKWNPIEKGCFHYLEIGDNITVGVDPDQTRMDFLEEIEEAYKEGGLIYQNTIEDFI